MNLTALWKYIAVAALLLATLFPVAYAQQVKAGITPSVYNALIGQQIQLSLTLSQPGAAGPVFWPLIGDTIGGFEVLERSPIDTVRTEKSSTLSQKLLVTAFDSGLYRIPSVSFYLADSTAVLTAPIGIQINTVPVDTAQAFRAIKAPIDAPYTFRDFVPYLILGLILLGIAGGLIYHFSRKKKKPQGIVLAPRIVIPPHEVAMRKLALLEEKRLWQQGETKPYYSEITDILREYIEARYRVPALESTTGEILTSLQEHLPIPMQREKLRELLLRADLVKFAKFKPDPTAQMAEMEIAREFVKSTREVPASVKPPTATPETAETT